MTMSEVWFLLTFPLVVFTPIKRNGGVFNTLAFDWGLVCNEVLHPFGSRVAEYPPWLSTWLIILDRLDWVHFD